MPATIPSSVWEQIPVVIIFAVLLAGLGMAAFKEVKESLAEINKHYMAIADKSNQAHIDAIKANNEQWQQYFTAKSEVSAMVNAQVIEELKKLASVVSELVEKFDSHDLMERQALDEMSSKRKLAKPK